MKAAGVEHINWKQELCTFLRQYRASSHTLTGFSPFELMSGRESRTRLPQIATPTTETSTEWQARLKTKEANTG